MNINSYQEKAAGFAIYPMAHKLVYPALGLASEAGEVAGKVKKVLRDSRQCNLDEISSEIGDCLWYLAALCTDLGLDLDTVAAENIAKLASRKARGVLSGSGDRR